MQPNTRPASPYAGHVQAVGEANRLKRLNTFLELVVHLCEVDGGEYMRYKIGDERSPEEEERDFIEDCRLRLRAVAACRKYPEIYEDLLCRYLIEHAGRASDKRVPLVGDCNRLKKLAQMYHTGTIKGLVTALAVTYANSGEPGQASEGATVLVTLGQRNAIRVQGGVLELRKRLRTALSGLPKLDDAETETRVTFLEAQVRDIVAKTEIPGWHCVQIAVYPADYALYKNGDLERMDHIFPENAAAHGGFYEHAFLRLTVDALTDEQKTAMARFLRPKDYDGNFDHLLQFADMEDIYRVLTYLRRLKK